MGRTLIGMFVMMAGFGGPGLSAAHAQAPDSSGEAQVDWAVHGADGQGKDGPMSSLDRGLIALYYRYRAHKAEASSDAPFKAHENMPVQDSLVTIDAIASGAPEALLDSLRRLGLQKGARAGRLVSGKLPIGALRAAAQLSGLQSMRPAQMSSDLGSITPPPDTLESQRDDAAYSHEEEATPSAAGSSSESDPTMQAASTVDPDSAATLDSETNVQEQTASDSASAQPDRASKGDSVVEQGADGSTTNGWRMYAVGGGVLLLGIGVFLILRRRASHGD